MRSAAGLCLIAAAAACQRTELIEPPPLAGARALVAVVLGEADKPGAIPDAPKVDGLQAQSVAASGLDPDTDHWGGIRRSGPVDLFVLLYQCSLSALSLLPGEMHVTLDRHPERSVPSTAGVASRHFGDDGPEGEWTMLGGIAPAADDTLYHVASAETSCARYGAAFSETEPVPMDIGGARPYYTLALGDGSVIVGGVDRAVRVWGNGTIEPFTFPGLSEEVRTAYRDSTGELWVMSFNGIVRRGPLEGPFVALPGRAPLSQDPYAARASLAVQRKPDGSAEVLVTSAFRAFARHDGSTWVTLASAPAALQPIGGIGFGFKPALLPLPSGGFVTFGIGSEFKVQIWENGALREEPMPINEEIIALVPHPVLGFVSFSNKGHAFRRSAEGWVDIGDTGLNAITTAVAEGGGFLFFGYTRELHFKFLNGRFHSDTGYCLDEPVDPVTNDLIRLDDDTVLRALSAGESRSMAVFLRRIEPFAECSIPPP